MKRLLPLVAIAISSFVSQSTLAQIMVCQDMNVQLDNAGNYSFNTALIPVNDAEVLLSNASTNNTFRWQSFTPTIDGILDNIEVTFSSLSGGNSLTFNVYSGQGNGGALLYSEPLGTPLTGSVTVIDIDATIDLTNGVEYTFEIIDASGNFAVRAHTGDLYAGGISSIGATTDLTFSLDILQRPDIDNGSADPDGIDHWTLSPSAFICSNVGTPVAVTLTAFDKLGNSSTCISNVTVQDTENPVAACQNTTVALNGAGTATIIASSLNNGSTDNCTLTYSASQTSFNCSNVGANTVTLTVEDPAGNTDDCTATVTVTETTPPNAICQNVTLVLNGSGSATLTVGQVNNGSTDNCGIATRTISKNAFTCGDLGANTVTLTVTDVNTNVSTCTSTVTVQDDQIPAIVCPADITVCSTDNSGSIVSYIEPNGTDNCSSTTTQTDLSGLTNGSLFPIGTTVQTWTVTDIATNTSSCSFNVNVDAKPIADFTHSSACLGEAIFFTDESTIDPSTNIAFWTWNMGDGSGPITLVDPIHSYAAVGTYNVSLLVETPEGCVDLITQTVEVTPVPTASFTFAQACEGAPTAFTNTSTIAAGNLNHSWDFGDGTLPSTDENPSHVYAIDGTYTVTLTVTSDDGCEDISTASVQVFNSPTALFTASTVCEGVATTFTNLSTGNGALSYVWDFGDLSPVSTDANPSYTYAADGVYTVTLTTTNASLCSNTHTASVTVNDLPTASFTFSDVCEGTPANFMNTSSPGSYNWDLGDNSSSTNLSVDHPYSLFGNYNVTLTVTSPQFCVSSITQSIEIFDLPNFTLTPTDVSCFGEATGQLQAVAIPPAASPWTLSIDGGTPQSSVFFGSLSAGTYAITAFDANGCEFTVSGTVSQPSDTLGIVLNNIDNILCHGASTGVINISGTGGTSPYQYSIDGNPLQAFGGFSGLEAGTHDIQIVDFNACVFDTTITLTEPDTLVLTLVNSNDLLCNGDNAGNLTVLGTGGVGSYQYNLDGGTYGTSALFGGLAAGTYIVGVSDSNGCTDTLHVTLTEPGVLQLSLINSEDALCNGSSNASIEAQASSGTAPYLYSLDGMSFQGSGLFQGLSAGTYTVTVMDANGCSDDLTETVFEPSLLTIETNSTPINCFGDQSGTIQIIAGGGTTAYQYSIDGGDSFQTNGGSYSNLEGNNYLAVVRDANGCTASEGVIISEPSSAFDLSANVTNVACMGDSTGSVLLVGTGGTPTYTYSANNSTFVSGNVFGDFHQGTFQLYARDLNGCVDSVQFSVGQPSSHVVITNTLLSDPACPNQASGAVTVLASGGTPGYMYSSNGGTTYQSGSILSGIGGGSHLVVVKDAQGCMAVDTVTLVSPPLLDILIDTIVNIDCQGDFDGEIHVTAAGGTPTYSYRLNNGGILSNGDWTHLTNTTYNVTIMDVNGCTYSEAITVSAAQMQPVAAFGFTVSTNAVLFQNNSSFGNSYLWDFGDGATSTDADPVHVYGQLGNYTVTLTVTNDCGSNSSTVLVSTISTGIGSEEQTNFSIYPNPASSDLYLQSSQTLDGNVAFEVITISGQVVLSEQIGKIQANNRTLINVNGLAQGMYYLRVVSEKEQSVLRFDIIK